MSAPAERCLHDLSLMLLVAGYGIAFSLGVLGHEGGPKFEATSALATFFAATVIYGGPRGGVPLLVSSHPAASTSSGLERVGGEPLEAGAPSIAERGADNVLVVPVLEGSRDGLTRATSPGETGPRYFGTTLVYVSRPWAGIPSATASPASFAALSIPR